MQQEEFSLSVTAKQTILVSSDIDGLRRGIYFLEDRICEAEGKSITEGVWQRKPFVKHRVSRCFFGPTNRPPFFIDELNNDIDYYPEEYLNKLAHEGVNALWLTMYFRDLPSSIFPGRGQNWEKQKNKLYKTVEKCMRYGIRIFIFLSEPKRFGYTYFSQPYEDAAPYPDIIGTTTRNNFLFCTSTKEGMKYMEESISTIFSSVPRLGGVINIMSGEDNGSCAGFTTVVQEELQQDELCPRCSKRDPGDIFCEIAEMFTNTIRKYNPDAEYVGWFYAPRLREDTPYMDRLLHVVSKWPKCASLMFNFESGGKIEQLGKERVVFDYSLAYVGPSKLFKETSENLPKVGAKLQVGCSHENASIPFMPVPENLYLKYKFLFENKVNMVMQCWYFGNYPGVMNQAAGALSFEPFFDDSHSFLSFLARPQWGIDSDDVATAWEYFSKAYRNFPANLMFEWYGPLHHCIAWPLHLFPTDTPISPSWILKNFPEISGDRFGEFLGFYHTIDEALTLCNKMKDLWGKGVEILESLRKFYQDDPPRIADMNLAKAIFLQIKSCCNLLEFYQKRERMLFEKEDELLSMKEIVLDEINNTEEMCILCQQDSRLGYHSEAEGYLFFPEKLKARIELLEELLNEDFPRFNLSDAWIKEYTGENPIGKKAILYLKDSNIATNLYYMSNCTSWQGEYDENNLYLRFNGCRNKEFILYIEPSRMSSGYRIIFRKGDILCADTAISCTIPNVQASFSNDDVFLTIPLSIFDGFRRKNLPMRMNIWSTEDTEFYWVEPKVWPNRLQHGDFNPNQTGWLILAN
jgi:hypothetical protein